MTYNTPNRITAINSQTVLNDLLTILSKETSGIIINMEKTSYISSAALRALIITEKSAKIKGLPSIKLINVNSNVLEIIKLTGFDGFFTIE